MAVKRAARGERGIPGPPGKPGPIGERGATGARGARGATGAMGATGVTGTSSVADHKSRINLLSDIDKHIDNIYRELDRQMSRSSQIQRELDDLRTKLRVLMTAGT